MAPRALRADIQHARSHIVVRCASGYTRASRGHPARLQQLVLLASLGCWLRACCLMFIAKYFASTPRPQKKSRPNPGPTQALQAANCGSAGKSFRGGSRATKSFRGSHELEQPSCALMCNAPFVLRAPQLFRLELFRALVSSWNKILHLRHGRKKRAAPTLAHSSSTGC